LDELRADDPRQVGSYTLIARLGSGGMGQVYFGRSLGGRDVAVKVIRADLARDQSFRLRFAREVETARRVSGAFTAPVIDADPEAPVPWLVTGYVNGPSLADAVERHGPLPLASVLALAAGLAEGLSAVHGVGVIHRDLKPANVLLAPDGPRLIDFGISQAADYAQITSTGMAIGTPGFMSPEQILGDPVGPSSDIFTMGAVLAFAATGEQPFGIGSADVRNQRVLHLVPRLDKLPAELRPLAERCMAKEPADRPTASQFLAELVTAHPHAANQADWLPADILAEARRRVPVLLPSGGTPGQYAETLLPPDVEPLPLAQEQGSQEQGQANRKARAPGWWADRTRTSTSTAPPSAPVVPAAGPPRNQQRRRFWAVGGVAAVAVLGTVIGLLAAPGAGPSAPARQLSPPIGLAALKETATSVTLEWNAHAGGPRPGKYEILENDEQLTSVPGDQTKYQVTGLTANTAYQFSVIAVTGTSRSAESATVLADTADQPAPPLADAPFTWAGTVISQETAGTDSYLEKVGTSWQDAWNVSSSCGSRVCATATLSGTIDNVNFTATLTRSGTTYTGVAAIDNYWLDCLHQSNHEDTTLSIKLKVTREGQIYGQEWTVSAFTGTETWNVPALPDGCAGSLYQIQVNGNALS
jgi:serine/threonine protein kinase